MDITKYITPQQEFNIEKVLNKMMLSFDKAGLSKIETLILVPTLIAHILKDIYKDLPRENVQESTKIIGEMVFQYYDLQKNPAQN